MSPAPCLRSLFSLVRVRWLGVAVAAGIAAVAALLAAWPPVARAGLSAMTLAIGLGICVGNAQPALATGRAAEGVDFARGALLRAGVVLYGFRISFQDIGAVGWPGLLISVAVVAMVFGAAVFLGTRWLGLDRETSMLIGAGSAICGAAAVMATQPVIRGEERKVSIAVATVVVFGTLAMVAYPLAYPHLGLSEHAFGLLAGSTVHEVAQVVAVGEAVGGAAARAAVVEKMLRVMLLAPFLVLLSACAASAGPGRDGPLWRRVRVPWFAFAFIGASALHSLRVVPPPLVAALVWLGTLVLATAMAAMGLRTSLGSLRMAGLQPLKLAGLLFLLLTVGGYGVNRVVLWWLA